MVNQDSDMQNWCRTVWALCFVPEEEVLKVWTDVIHKSAPFVTKLIDPDYDGSLLQEEVIQWNTALDNYIKYLEYTWIGCVSPKTAKRGSGLYKIHIWNKYKEIKGGEVDLTSNRSEAYNSAMKISSRMKPNNWCILK